MPQPSDRREGEWRTWTLASALTSALLTVALAYGAVVYYNLRSGLPLEPWQHKGLELLLVGGTVGSLIRTVVLGLRAAGPRPRG